MPAAAAEEPRQRLSTKLKPWPGPSLWDRLTPRPTTELELSTGPAQRVPIPRGYCGGGRVALGHLNLLSPHLWA